MQVTKSEYMKQYLRESNLKFNNNAVIIIRWKPLKSQIIRINLALHPLRKLRIALYKFHF